MTCAKQDAIGKAGQKRIKKALEDLGCTDVEINQQQNGHPDCVFTYLGKVFAIECKTMAPSYSKKHDEEQVNHAHLRQTEINAMVSKIKEGYIPGMIIEIRPQGTRRRPLYFIEWGKVLKEYNSTKPEVKSLSLYWIMDVGIPLKTKLALFYYEDLCTAIYGYNLSDLTQGG